VVVAIRLTRPTPSHWRTTPSSTARRSDRDVARAHRVAAQLETGMVWVNDHHRLDPSSPVRDSGIGREADGSRSTTSPCARSPSAPRPTTSTGTAAATDRLN
jgi:hypothetical protein